MGRWSAAPSDCWGRAPWAWCWACRSGHFPWSLAGAILGAILQSLLTRPERRSLGLFPGVAVGSLVGILLRAVRTESDRVTTGASDGALIGAVLGVFLIPALLAWLIELPTLLRKRRKR